MNESETADSSLLPVTRSAVLISIGDLVGIAAVLLIGMVVHATNPLFNLSEAVTVVFPFVFGWITIGVLAGSYEAYTLLSIERTVRIVTVGWFGAVTVGSIARSSPLFDGNLAWPFVLIIAGFGLVVLLSWRLIWILLIQ